MGISQALYTGVTGLAVNADGMSVIANNIANANAKGFKRDRTEFEDMLSREINSGSGTTQIGRGARLANVKTIHTQGSLAVTDNLTDLAIQGNGFFVLADPLANSLESAGKYYTRSGSLNFDKEGYLATSFGSRVQGYMADAKGNLRSRLTDIRIETNTIPPQATTNVMVNVQLDSRVPIIEKPFDINNTTETSNFGPSFTVFDSHGRSHQVTTFFRKTSSSEEGTEWEWHAAVDSSEVTNPSGFDLTEFANGKVRFNKNGMLLEEITDQSSINFSNGAFPNQQIAFDFGRNVAEEGGTGINAATSIAGKSVLNFHQQDGYEAGQLKSLQIESDGRIRGVFSNGVQRDLASVALATFSNQDALMKAGRNMFYSTIKSGPPNIGTPETGARGSLYSSSLEESNVDLAGEFVNMITTQRLFQANSRSITTTDAMIEEVINLKR